MENYIGKICPFCKTEITQNDTVKVCLACGIPHHEGCWEENRGCTTPGCSERHYEVQCTDSTDVCGNCGAPLGDGQAFCSKCGTPTVASKKNVCGKCGNELQDGQEFCSKCGQKVNLVMTPEVSAAGNQFNINVQKKGKKSVKLPIIFGAIAAVVITLVLLLKGPFVDEIVLSKSSVELKVGTSTSVSYTIAPDKASDTDVIWKSSDESVATVDGSGEIETRGEGSCTIKATAGGKSDTIQVKVTAMSWEERQLLGTWYSVAAVDDYDELIDLSSSVANFCAYDDFTGKTTAGDTIIHFTWEFSKYVDGDCQYKMKTEQGAEFEFRIIELAGEDSIVLPLDGLVMIFQK